MPSRTLAAAPTDSALRGLTKALDPDHMRPLLAEATGLPSDSVCSVAVVKHIAGKRCTIRYELSAHSAEESPQQPRAMIGKVYRSRRRAARVHDATTALHSDTFDGRGPLRIPTPLLMVPDLRLALQEFAPGEDLRHALAAGAGDAPVALAARWLAALHHASPPPGLKATSLAHELEKMERWRDEIAAHLLPPDERRLRDSWQGLRGLTTDIPERSPALIHKDYYYAHVYWDGENVWALDFDQLSTGDPAFDVGHFLAHLENLAYHATGRADAYETSARRFVRAYQEHASVDLRTGLPFYRAYTFLKLAATDATRKRPGWRDRVAVLTRLACHEAEGGAWARP